MNIYLRLLRLIARTVDYLLLKTLSGQRATITVPCSLFPVLSHP